MAPLTKAQQALADLQAKVRSYERHKDDLRAELAAAQLAHASASARAENAESQRDALRQLVADLCRTRTGKEFSTYEESLTWMRARAIAGGEGL